MKHYNIIVKGKVQGVWFRKSTENKASDLGIKGFVRNEPDGTVYIEAEGSEEQLEQLLQWCHDGPEAARVRNVIHEEDEIKKFKEFSIER